MTRGKDSKLITKERGKVGETVERSRFKSSPLTALTNFYHQVCDQARDLWRKWATRLATGAKKESMSASLPKLSSSWARPGFGGGLAVIAHVRRVVVYKNPVDVGGEFLDSVSLAQSLPGANTANAITYIGLKLCGIRGALVSVASFVLPSFLAMVGLAIAYGYLKNIPDAQRVFQGFNAAVVGLIAATTVRLGQSAITAMAPGARRGRRIHAHLHPDHCGRSRSARRNHRNSDPPTKPARALTFASVGAKSARFARGRSRRTTRARTRG